MQTETPAMIALDIRAFRRLARAGLAALLAATAPGVAAHPPSASPETGFLVVAADRGFQGNEEIRDAFESLAKARNAALAVATDGRTRDSLRAALGALAKHGATRVLVLPAFIAASDSQLSLVKTLLAEDKTQLPVSFAAPFGASYFAVEALADSFRAIRDPKGRRVIVVGYGAAGEESADKMERDWERLATRAAEGFGFSSVRTAVWNSGHSADNRRRQEQFKQQIARAAQDGWRTVVVPFHLGRKLDGMMSFDAELRRMLPAGAEFVAGDAAAASLLATWMAREANRNLALAPGSLGVVVLAHGADFHWNDTIVRAANPLEARYMVEYCFSMADQPLIERAVRRLEQRGAQAAVIVRVFGLAASFRPEIERMIGLDVERATVEHAAHASHPAAPPHSGSHARADDQGHGHVPGAGPPARIRTTLPIVTVGGVEANALFAQALLDRAKELSRQPERETVILTAHGAGDDADNEDWIRRLESLAGQMRSNGGAAFRAIRFATWREDWPEKRAPWVAKARDMVQEAARDGGRALVVPARVNGRGPEREYLKGLDFELGSGFAPHPLFARWMETQVQEGAAALAQSNPNAAASAAVESPVHRH